MGRKAVAIANAQSIFRGSVGPPIGASTCWREAIADGVFAALAAEAARLNREVGDPSARS